MSSVFKSLQKRGTPPGRVQPTLGTTLTWCKECAVFLLGLLSWQGAHVGQGGVPSLDNSRRNSDVDTTLALSTQGLDSF